MAASPPFANSQNPHLTEFGDCLDLGYAVEVMDNLTMAQLQRITIDPEICGGRPTIRKMRIRVSDVLDLLAAGETRAAILEDYPYLEDADITAVLEYAAASAAHRVIAAE